MNALILITDSATTLAALPVLVPMDVDITPNDDGLPGIAQLRTIVGAVMTIGLILSVLALIISAIVWGFGANSSNPHLAGRGKTGVLVSCGAAVICGAMPFVLAGSFASAETMKLLGLEVKLQDLAGFFTTSNSPLLVLALIWRPLVLECVDPGFLRLVSRWSGPVHFVFLGLVVVNLVAGFQALGKIVTTQQPAVRCTFGHAVERQVGDAHFATVVGAVGHIQAGFGCDETEGVAGTNAR